MLIEKISYGGWPNCYRLTDGTLELIVTSDIGPRVIRCGFVGGQNLFREFEDQLGHSGEPDWQIRGGHRLWIGPEDIRYTYGLDNSPVAITLGEGRLTATQPVEPETGLQKEMELALVDGGVRVTHRVTNRNRLAVEFAVWGPSVMAQGGVGITGFPPRGTHPEMLAPTNPLVMWAYTDFSDPRWIFMKKYLALRQDPQAATPQKIGLYNPHTFGAYLLNGELFLKQYKADPTRVYPEFHCSFQTFTNRDFLELETFGPLGKVQPDETVSMVEHWTIHRGIDIPAWTDAAVDAVLLPLLK
jgi:hypothetical protein